MSGDKGVGIKGWLSGPKQHDPRKDSAALEALDKHRIAVLPMSNISPDTMDEYFADGMTDEMISTVSKIEGLEVISRTSIMQYKKNPRPAKEVSLDLSVGTILEGSVRKAGNKLRVTVQLIDAARDKHLWSNSYDREIQDVFAIQTDIAESVADHLKLQLLGEKRSEIKKRNPANPDAYALYLKGRFYWNERNPESVKKAIQYFESAIAKDPKFAMPYVGLADCNIVLVDQGLLDGKEYGARTRSLLEKALTLDPKLAEAHTSLANMLDRDWNWSAARAEYLKAIELDPNYATAHHWYSIHLASTDQGNEGLAEIRIALRLDPISPTMNANLGLRLAETGHFKESIEQLERTVAMEPGYGLAHAHLGQIYVSQSEIRKGIEQLQIADRILGGSWGKALLGYTYALNSERGKALGLLAELETMSKTGYVSDALVGVVKFALGDKEKAFSLMKKSVDEKSATIPYIRTFPVFKEIRADPRFKNLLDKMLR